MAALVVASAVGKAAIIAFNILLSFADVKPTLKPAKWSKGAEYCSNNFLKKRKLIPLKRCLKNYIYNYEILFWKINKFVRLLVCYLFSFFLFKLPTSAGREGASIHK